MPNTTRVSAAETAATALALRVTTAEAAIANGTTGNAALKALIDALTLRVTALENP